MEKLKLNIPIYVSVISMAKDGLNVNEAIMDQLNQGDPAMDEIVEKLEDMFGESNVIDTADFSPFIEGDKDSISINADEMASIDMDYETIVLDVDFTFNVEEFAKENNLEPIRERILSYIEGNKKCFELEGVEITEDDVDNVLSKIRDDGLSLETSCDEVLQGIRDTLDEKLSERSEEEETLE